MSTIKQNGTYKARLVVVGCRDNEQHSKIDTASPTPSAATIRWFFSIASLFGWEITQIDLVNAYLNGIIDREKFVTVPQGLNLDSKHSACKLNKALYGLATGPICFNRTFDSFLRLIGFTRNSREPCIYSKHNG